MAVTSATGNIFADAAVLAANAYSDTPAGALLGWQPLGPADMGMTPAGSFNAGTYLFADGVYVGTDAANSAVAHVYVGERDGETTLALAFRGTDEIPGDLPDHLHFADHYAQFEPLISAVQSYADDPSHDIDRVLVTGHSLGSGMVSTAMIQEGWVNDPKYLGVAIASHGADASVASTAPAEVTNLVNFIHTQDFLVLAQEGGLPASALAAAVAMPSFGSQEDFEPKERVGVDVWIDTGNAARLFVGTFEDPITAEHRIGRYEADITALAQQEALEPGALLETAEAHYFAVGTQDADSFAQDQFSFDDQLNRDLFPTKDFDQQIFALDGDDKIGGSGGDDLIDGGAGNDIAYYRGNGAEYMMSAQDGFVAIVHTSGTGPSDGADLLKNVETLRFADGSRTLPEIPAAGSAPDDDPAITVGNLLDEPSLRLIAIRNQISDGYDQLFD